MCYLIIELDPCNDCKVCENICGILGAEELINCRQRVKGILRVAVEIDDNLTKKERDELLYVIDRKITGVLDTRIEKSIDAYVDKDEAGLISKENILNFGTSTTGQENF